MSISFTEKWFNVNSLTNLPKQKTIIEFCSSIDIPAQLDTKWLTLFEFLTYNMSLSNTPLKHKVEELTYFLQLKDQKPQIFNSFNSSINLQVIRNYFSIFTKDISHKQFYNKKENLSLLLDLFNLIPRLYISKNEIKEIQNKELFIDKSISVFLLLLNETSKKYEKSQLNIYKYYINKLLSGNLSFSLSKSVSNEMKSESNGNEFCHQQKQLSSKFNPRKIIYKRIKTKVRSMPFLIDICNNNYHLHSKQAKFYSCAYYHDKQYTMTKIGSYTLGLNRSESSIDYVIGTKHKTRMICHNEVILWLNKATFFNLFFSFDSESSNSFCSKILLFTTTNITTKQQSKAQIFLYDERYTLINQIFKNFFSKGNVFSKLYVFFIELLCLESGFQLCLLIHAFFICYYDLYFNEKKFHSYKCLSSKQKEAYTLKSKSFFNFEVTSQNFITAANDNVDRLIPAFLEFFLQLTSTLRTYSQINLLKRKNYLFSIEKVLLYLFKNKDEEYWLTLRKFNDMLYEKNKIVCLYHTTLTQG